MTAAPRIETERLVLRSPQASDLPAWTAFQLSDRSRYVRTGEVTEDTAWRAFASVCGHEVLRGFTMFVFALKETPDEPLGLAGPWFPHGWPEREIGWTLWSEAAEGKGYAREAAHAARAHAYETLGWEGAVSYIDPRNTRSIRLAERLGATPDWSAKTPRGEPCVVFRHPSPEELT